MTGRHGVHPDDWTDEEWLRLLRELPPDAPAEEAARLVRAWRASAAAARRKGRHQQPDPL